MYFVDPGDYDLPNGYSSLYVSEFGGRFIIYISTGVDCPYPMWLAGNPRKFMNRQDAISNHRFVYFDSIEEALTALEQFRKADTTGWNDHE